MSEQQQKQQIRITPPLPHEQQQRRTTPPGPGQPQQQQPSGQTENGQQTGMETLNLSGILSGDSERFLNIVNSPGGQ